MNDDQQRVVVNKKGRRECRVVDAEKREKNVANNKSEPQPKQKHRLPNWC